MARTMSPEEYLELGKIHYNQKQYERAVEAFTNGIEAATIPSIGLYDHRAASYAKLNDLKSAVKDGREMIKLDKMNVKGYLRTGSVLEKMNKLETAIGIYRYGMKHVSMENKSFKLLRRLHDEFTRKLSPAKAVDPFTVFPPELIEMVISYFTFKDIVNCHRVCKDWRTYLINNSKLWIDLDLSGARKDVSRIFVRNALYRSKYHIERATIHRFKHFDVLLSLATACRDVLTQLEFISGPVNVDRIVEVVQCAQNLKELIYRDNISLDAVAHIMHRGKSLERVEFTSIAASRSDAVWKGKFPKLDTLVLNGPTNGAPRALNTTSLTMQTPALRVLTLTNWSGGGNFSEPLDFSRLSLEKLTLTKYNFQVFPALPPTLTHLILEPAYGLYVPAGQNDNSSPWTRLCWRNILNSHLPALRHLSLSNFVALSPSFFSLLLETRTNDNKDPEVLDCYTLSTMTTLHHLSIRNSTFSADRHHGPFSTEGILGPLRILSPSLQCLTYASMMCSDDDVEELVHPLLNLEAIDLSNTNITGAGVKMLADGLPKLAQLNVDGCSRISSRDAIDYAEKKGIRVSWRMKQTGGGGRKVRYG
ncbi:hypothetical protein CC78DRAFT_530257 [Lojkania enalia]|uniref:F-box domain-containing protein n=1 Tax=Lojkania enalia TaxID=147567 RepID=A0A9P4KGJ0_9PLEO|nr:hypothetical protein CC78DRAFT_530257 [Didymosphaeria enalia]